MPNDWLPQPDGIRHRNSVREYLARELGVRVAPSTILRWVVLLSATIRKYDDVF